MEKLVHIHQFVLSYLVTARWSSSDGDVEILDGFEWSDEAKAQAYAECAEFIKKVQDTFTPELAHAILNRCGEQLDSLAAHDFWLTRAHHGAGFWDGGWDSKWNYSEDWGDDPETYKDEVQPDNLGDMLTEISQTFREINVYIGDDKLLYFM